MFTPITIKRELKIADNLIFVTYHVFHRIQRSDFTLDEFNRLTKTEIEAFAEIKLDAELEGICTMRFILRKDTPYDDWKVEKDGVVIFSFNFNGQGRFLSVFWEALRKKLIPE